ncbi:MAG: hypothetical protein ACO1SV_18370 [Fimbriimonas sp.]
MTSKIFLTLATVAWGLPALAQERPPGLKDPGQLPPNRPLAVPT